jgi:hypothetical protein
MMFALFEELSSLRAHTALLEQLDWDEDRLAQFMSELEMMLLSSPPNVDKAIFWLRNTPWDTFNKKQIPEQTFRILENEIRRSQRSLQHRVEAAKMNRLDHDSSDDGWN